MVVRYVENREENREKETLRDGAYVEERKRSRADGRGKGGVTVSRESSLSICLEGCLCGQDQQRTSFKEKKTGQCDYVVR